MNRENIGRLITHYESVPGVQGWGYAECVAGVLAQLGIIRDRMEDCQVVDALGVSMSKAIDMISGPRSAQWMTLDDVQRRDNVIGMLQGVLAGGDVDWNRVRI